MISTSTCIDHRTVTPLSPVSRSSRGGRARPEVGADAAEWEMTRSREGGGTQAPARHRTRLMGAVVQLFLFKPKPGCPLHRCTLHCVCNVNLFFPLYNEIRCVYTQEKNTFQLLLWNLLAKIG